jgi:ribosomal protein S18 acetylase RimI-like enzyme
MGVRIEPVAAADWPALAPFVFATNTAGGALRCLHSHGGPDAARYADELRSLAADAACLCAAWRGERLVGVTGAEFDVTLGRAWLRGPLVATGEDFAGTGAALLDALDAALPAAVKQQAAFVAATCADALALLGARGFVVAGQHDEFVLTEPPAAAPLPADVRVVPVDQTPCEALSALHEAEFPNAYLPAAKLFSAGSAAGAESFTRVALLDGVPAGYLHAHFDAPWNEGYIDFVAVDPAARGGGVGRALLSAAIDWTFNQRGARALTLTVRSDRLAARALYLAAGFRHQRTGIDLRRESPR